MATANRYGAEVPHDDTTSADRTFHTEQNSLNTRNPFGDENEIADIDDNLTRRLHDSVLDATPQTSSRTTSIQPSAEIRHVLFEFGAISSTPPVSVKDPYAVLGLKKGCSVAEIHAGFLRYSKATYNAWDQILDERGLKPGATPSSGDAPESSDRRKVAIGRTISQRLKGQWERTPLSRALSRRTSKKGEMGRHEPLS